MDTARWDRAGSIFERVLGAAEAERPTLLDSLCGDDGELRNIVLSMLDSENSALRFEERILRRAAIVPSGDTTSEVAVGSNPALAFSKITAWMNEMNRCFALTSAARAADDGA